MIKKTDISFHQPHFPILLLSLLVAILNSCVISPIYVQIESDIAFEYTILPVLFNYAVLIFDTLYISFLISALSFSVYGIYNRRVTKKSTYIYTITIVIIKHILNLTVSSIIDGYMDFSFDIPMTLCSIVIDLLILSVIALISNHICKKHFAHVNAMLKASKYLETVEYNKMEDVFPFKGFLKIKRNPVLIPAFAGAATTALIFILQRLFADFVVLGAPSTVVELADIFISYTIDVLFGLLAYTVSYFALTYIFLNNVDN